MIPTEEQALSILKREGADEKLVRHCTAVKDLAAGLAGKAAMKMQISLPAVIAASLLHDIGRTRSQAVDHGVLGAAIARSYGVDEQVCRIIERHVGSGLDDEDAARFGLPAGKIYVPTTIEEKIVCYADKVIFPGGTATHQEAVDSFRKDIGEGQALARLEKLLKEVAALCS